MSLNVKEEAALEALPRGRHNLPAHVVLASQRARLLRAILECVGSNGYAATTVPQVVAAAKVSRNAFYELFNDKLDCFLALCDVNADAMLGEIAVPEEANWRDALRTGVRRYLRRWQEDPAFTRTYFVELPFAGPRAVEQRARTYERFGELFDGLAAWARVQEPGLPPLRPRATQAVVYAVTEIVAEQVRAGRVDRLPELEDDLVAIILALLA